MPRGPRLDAPDVLHHVIARGIERGRIFSTDADRLDFLTRLGDLVTETQTSIYAWCLIPNHFHLLARTGPAPLSTVMRRLLTGYAVSFNRRHRRAGHLFQNRFKSIVVQQEPYFLELVRYIHLNPVRSHLVPDVDALDLYPWSGHSTLLGRVCQPWQNTDFVLAHFGATVPDARPNYGQFVRDGVTQGRRPDLVGGGLRRSRRVWRPAAKLERGREAWAFDERILGSSEFVTEILTELREDRAPAVQLEPGEVVQKLLGVATKRFTVGSREISSNSHRPAAVTARAWVSYAATRHYGLTPTQVARELGVSRQSVTRGFERAQQLALDPNERSSPPRA